MLDYVYHHDQVVAQFVASLIPECRDRGFGQNVKAFGVIVDGVLTAGVVFHNWNPEAGVIEISIAALPGKKWLSRETLRRMHAYPFLDCRCQMTMMIIPEDNERALRQLAAFGYAFILLPRLLGRDRNAVLCQLTYEDWLENRFNRRVDAPQLSEAA